MVKDFICPRCDNRCIVNVDKYNDYMEIQGNQCDEGAKYIKEQINDNKDIFTTLVRIKGSSYNVVPVKSSMPLDKKLWVECSKALSRLYVGSPIKVGDIVCKNILNTGVDIICTKNID